LLLLIGLVEMSKLLEDEETAATATNGAATVLAASEQTLASRNLTNSRYSNQ